MPVPLSDSSCQSTSCRSRVSSPGISQSSYSPSIPPQFQNGSLPSVLLDNELSSVPLSSIHMAPIDNTIGASSTSSLSWLRIDAPFSGRSTNENCSKTTEFLKDRPRRYKKDTLAVNHEKRQRNRLASVLTAFEIETIPDSLSELVLYWAKHLFRLSRETSLHDKTIPIFEHKMAGRLNRLKQAGERIQKSNWEASRLWLICVHHELDYISRSAVLDDWTSQGVDRMSAAVKIATKSFGNISQYAKLCKKMVDIMTEGGLASLLTCSTISLSGWNELSSTDINTVFLRRKKEFPEIDQSVRSQDQAISSAYITLFSMCGWPLEEFRHSKTQVANILNLYLPPETQDLVHKPGPGNPAKRQRLHRPSTPPAISYTSHEVNNGTRDLTDPVTARRFPFAVNDLSQCTASDVPSTTLEITDSALYPRIVNVGSQNLGEETGASALFKKLVEDARKSLDDEIARKRRDGVLNKGTMEFLEWTYQARELFAAFKASPNLLPVKRLGGNPSGKIKFSFPFIYTDVETPRRSFPSTALGIGILGIIALSRLQLPEIGGCASSVVESGSVAYFRGSSCVVYRECYGRGLMFSIQ